MARLSSEYPKQADKHANSLSDFFTLPQERLLRCSQDVKSAVPT